MAFIGAGRMADTERIVEAVRRSAAGSDDNGHMAREVGLPLAEGFLAFANGRHDVAVDNILAVRGIGQRLGGSHAQRDLLSRSEEPQSELQSLMRISYAVFCLKKKQK